MVSDADQTRAEDSFVTSLTSFRRPSHFLLPRRCPKLSSFLQVLPLLELLLAQVAAHNGVAVAVDAMSEVLAGPTALTQFTDALRRLNPSVGGCGHVAFAATVVVPLTPHD